MQPDLHQGVSRTPPLLIWAVRAAHLDRQLVVHACPSLAQQHPENYPGYQFLSKMT